VPLVYLLATAAAFDVWERRHDCATMGEGKAEKRRDGLAMHGTVALHAYQDRAAAARNEINK